LDASACAAVDSGAAADDGPEQFGYCGIHRLDARLVFATGNDEKSGKGARRVTGTRCAYRQRASRAMRSVSGSAGSASRRQIVK
jgi:hypothetical protein